VPVSRFLLWEGGERGEEDNMRLPPNGLLFCLESWCKTQVALSPRRDKLPPLLLLLRRIGPSLCCYVLISNMLVHLIRISGSLSPSTWSSLILEIGPSPQNIFFIIFIQRKQTTSGGLVVHGIVQPKHPAFPHDNSKWDTYSNSSSNLQPNPMSELLPLLWRKPKVVKRVHHK